MSFECFDQFSGLQRNFIESVIIPLWVSYFFIHCTLFTVPSEITVRRNSAMKVENKTMKRLEEYSFYLVKFSLQSVNETVCSKFLLIEIEFCWDQIGSDCLYLCIKGANMKVHLGTKLLLVRHFRGARVPNATHPVSPDPRLVPTWFQERRLQLPFVTSLLSSLSIGCLHTLRRPQLAPSRIKSSFPRKPQTRWLLVSLLTKNNAQMLFNGRD